MHTHYHPKTQTWFTLDTCEHCGGDVQAANAVKVSKDQQLQLVRMGVTIVETLPVEGYWSDAVEGEQCDNCLDNHDVTVTMSPHLARMLAGATITNHETTLKVAKEAMAFKRTLRRKLRAAGETTDEVHATQEREFPYVADGDVSHD
jgi:hypothetical protein